MFLYMYLEYIESVTNLLSLLVMSPFCTHFLGEVIISDNECTNGTEYVREKMDAKGKSTLYLEECKQVPTSESNKFNPLTTTCFHEFNKSAYCSKLVISNPMCSKNTQLTESKKQHTFGLE